MDQTILGRQQPASPGTPRYDIYNGIHKALRAFMSDTLIAVTRVDCSDFQEVAQVAAQVRELATFCESHLMHENEFVHTAMESRRPGSSGTTAEGHVHHVQEIAQLIALASAMEQSAAADRSDAAAQLRRCLALFIADNLTHMDIEETWNNAVLWATHTDEELLALEQAIVASLSPEEMALCLRWMIPAMNPAERSELISGMREHAPVPAFEGALEIARAHLSARDWNKLSAALALPDRLAA